MDTLEVIFLVSASIYFIGYTLALIAFVALMYKASKALEDYKHRAEGYVNSLQKYYYSAQALALKRLLSMFSGKRR